MCRRTACLRKTEIPKKQLEINELMGRAPYEVVVFGTVALQVWLAIAALNARRGKVVSMKHVHSGWPCTDRLRAGVWPQ